MAYTRNWDNTSPAGGSQLSAGDDAIRAMKVDLDERLSSVFEDIDVDPLALKSTAVGSIGAATGKQIILGPHEFAPAQDDDNIAWGADYVTFDNGPNVVMRAPVILPIGVTITLIELLADKSTATQISAVLRGKGFTGTPAAAADKHSAIVRTAAGVGIDSSGALTIAVVADEMLFMEVTGAIGGNARLYGVRITYDASSAAETL